jgi:hypothetical protein
VSRAQAGNQNCFALQLRNSTGGFTLKTLEPFAKGEKMVMGPRDIISLANAHKLENARGWESDFKVWHKGAGDYLTDLTMPDLSAYYPPVKVNGVGLPLHIPTPADMDDGSQYPWRQHGRQVPAGMSLWYFMDHARDSNVAICKNLVKVRKEGTECGFFRAVVFEAKRDIAAGERLTYTYESVPDTWVDHYGGE